MTEPAVWSEVRPKTLAGVLRARTAERPDQWAFTFLADGETEAGRLTYAELDARATAIAAALSRSVMPGERALLLFPPGLDFIAAFFGCLYAGVVAVPAYPPRPNDRSQSRLRSIARDAEPKAALTTSAILAGVEGPKGLLAIAPELGGLRWIPTDTPDLWTAGSGRELPDPDPESVAFLQYTSGSTSTPKGVMVTHANLVHNERMIGAAFEQDEDSVVVGWLPLYHDMGLIGNVLQPLHAGGRCVLMSPIAFLQKPLRWLAAISRYRATTSGGPNFAYELCLRKIGPEEKAGLDLSSWRVAYNGAEPVRAETLERFAEAFAPCGFRRASFYPCYGLAEATLFVTGGEPGRFPRVETVDAVALEHHEVEPAPPESPRARLLVSCGRPSLGQRVAIVDPETGMEQPPGRVGEIWIAGESVARGYWKRDEATERDFNAFLLGAGDGGEGPYLRTGDLGFLGDGELFVTGRLKDLIIIRGRNHYPQDVELTAERSHPDLRPGNGAAFSVEVGGEERLVLVHEVERRRREGLEEVTEAVRRAVAEEYEVQVHEVVLIRVGTLPKTSSGKVQRRLCRDLYLADELAVVGRSALATAEPAAESGLVLSRGALLALEPEERPGVLAAFLAERVAAAVGVSASAVSPEQPLTSLGLDSLAAVELKGSVEAALGLPVPLADLLQGIGTRALAEKILETGSEMGDVPPVRALSLTGDQPLSFGQKGLWFLERLTPGGGAYNIAVAARARGLDPAAFGRALEAVVSRHDALRTVFHLVGEEPAQRALPEARVNFAVEDASTWTERELEDRLAVEAWRPFSLETGPLVRLRVFERREGGPVLLFAVHHLVADFWSLGILARDLGALYRQETGGPAAELPPVALRYTDFVEWQAERLAGERGERLWDFWREHLSGLPDLDLPTDHPRPPVRAERGGARALALPSSLASEVRAFGASRGATLFMTLLAAFEAQLARTSGQEDFAVGSPTAGRSVPELSGLVGYLVNTVTLRADLSGEPGFGRLVERARTAALESLEHGDFPFPLVAERLRPARDPARSPLFQAMFVLQRGRASDDPGLAAFALGEDGARIGLGGATLESVRIAERRAQFDLTLRVTEDGTGGLTASLEYDASLWDGATAERMLGHFRTLLGAAVVSPETPVWHLPLLTAGERAQILGEWNETSRDYPRGLLLHERFEERAAERPRDEAVVAGDVRLTYEELNRRANQLAHHLRALGVMPEDRVGVCLRRSERMISTLLGILKAGGAYVPLDLAYPRERLELILTDSGARLVVTEEETVPDLAAFVEGRARRVLLDTDAERIALESSQNPERTAGPGNLAYLIYTSGSTGRPKAVAIEHRSPVVLVHWAREVFSPADLSDVLAATSIGFDLSVFEIFVPLSWGGRVVVAESALALPALPAAGEVTLVNTVPSALAELVRAGLVPESVRVINLAGEPIPPALVEAIHALSPPRRLYNLYGPSEDTTYSTFALLVSGSEAPIGRPLAETRVYLLDARGEPVPVGVPGELFLAGEGLARGYLGRPDLTAERFVPDPFAAAPGARLYRTGDLARFRPGGDLDFLGRIDHQVKVRGFRVELGEIEAALARHPQVREAVVVAKDDGDRGKRLVAYVTPRGVAASELRRFLRESLPEHMVPSAFVRLDTLPLSPNGKVDRKALPDPGFPGGDRAPAAPRSGAEELLAGLVAEVLGLPRVGPHDDFFALGGHSLLATRLVARIARVFGVELPVSAVFVTPTVSGLAARIAQAGPALPVPPLVPVPRDGSPLPLSFAQKRLWLLDRIEPGNPAYNVPGAVRLTGPLDLAALERSLEGIVRRHEALRTVFRMDRGQPVQAIQPAAARLPLVDLSELPALAREAEAERVSRRSATQPFDLWRGPLYRMLALRLAPADHLLLVTFHHIVADGWSLAVFWNELAVLYEGAPLPPLPVQYPDFAVWQREQLRGEVFERQLAWWRNQLADLPILELPTDHLRPTVRSFRGGTRTAFLPEGLTEALERLARRQGVTPFMALLAVFQTLLARWTGAPSIPVGSPVANRSQVETEGLIGFFVNTLVIRTEVGDDPAFAELLARVREVCLGAWAHQDLPFERLVEELRPERHLSQNPLFQVVFLLEEPLPARSLGGATAHARRVETGTAKFDATLAVSPEDGGLAVSLEYDAALFDPQTVDRLLGHWRTLLEGIVAGAGARLSDLPLLTAGELEQVLGSLCGVAVPYPREAAVHELFEAEVRRDPEAVALEIGDRRLTYGEVDLLANRLARRLRRAGVGLGSAVGLCVERSAALVVGMLGILKAGGAYVPLDPAYPEERLAFMAADAGIAALVTQRELLGALPTIAETVRVDVSGALEGVEESATPLPPLAAGGDLAYVMYTSGSTGRPKGVEVPHRAVTRLVRGTGYVRFGRFEVFLQLAPASFDAATFEVWGALLNGARLALFPGRAGTLEEIAGAVARHRVTTLWLTAGLFHSMVESRLSGLAGVSQLLAGGDVLAPEAVRRALSGLPGTTVINGYGPTENTTFTACHPMRDPGEVETPVSIGTPIANTRVHLLDRSLKPVPVGVPGELFAGGDGVARGYRGRPDLTAERFVPDPFGEEPGSRLYRTGDLARWRPSGKIEFLGRADRQVKIRGFRIEPAEIEAALALHPEVGAAAVVVRDDLPGGRTLVACAVPREGDELASDLRDFLRERLPEYMLPSFFVALPALPLTANGKVDRAALARLGPVPGEGEREIVLPRTPLEEMLAGIWSEVLGVATVGVHDNFFEMGGHSLLAVQVISRVSDALGVDLPLVDLFEEPTVAGLASRLAGALSAPQETRPAEPPAPPPPPLPESPPQSVPAAPRTPLEAKLVEIWSEVLGVPDVGVNDDFFELGGHSLTAHQVSVRVAREIGAELTAQSLFEAPTVAALAERLARLPAAPLPEPAPAADGRPLSFAQHRLWLTDLLEPGGTAYNLSVAARLEGSLALFPLVRALAEILRRHEPLRTVFPQAGGEPVQVVLPPAPATALPLARVDLRGVDPDRRDEALRAVLRAEAERPFDLARGPVARFLLVRLDAREHVLVVSFHHIAADGWSMGVFFEELAALYGASLAGLPSPLPELPLSYSDFALWQRREAESEAMQAQLAWWRRELAWLPVLELPTDRPRAVARSHRSANRPFAPSAELAACLRGLAPAEGITLFVALLGGFAAVLSRWSGQGDVPVGVPSAGRNRVETEGMIGFFVNTLVLRGRMEDDPPFVELLRRLRRTSVAAQANQDVPFDRLVEELHPRRDPGVSPLFQVMFTYLAVPPVAVRMPGLEASLLDVETRTAKFDLTLSLNERDGALSGFLEYRTELFEAATADRLLNHLTVLLEGAVADPGLRLSELPLLSEAERGQLLAWGGTPAPTGDLRLHRLFEERARISPDAPALLSEGAAPAVSFRELDLRANRLASRLRALGIAPEARVAVCLERSPDLVAAMLAVWKAGGVYVPVDPAYPRERIELLLRDSGATALVNRDGVSPTASRAGNSLNFEADPRSLAYVVYTSGSTGCPKGVAVEHGAAAAHCQAVRRVYGLGPGDRVLSFASPGFDVSIEQILPSLAAGAAVVLRGSELWEPGDLARKLEDLGVTVANLPTAYWQRFVRETGGSAPPSALRLVIAGGEAMTAAAARLWAETPLSRVRLLNAYGPTEAIVTATVWEAGGGISGATAPIGRPLPGRSAHAVDRHGGLVPLGVTGELLLGGLLARCYLGSPEETALRFVPDPFSGVPGERLYRTGDLVRRLPGGLEFLGRIDGQVKVRGFRIETVEVEAALTGHPAVREAVVMAVGEEDGRRLAAWVVPEAGASLSAAELQAFLTARLPAFLVPSSFTPLPALPLNPHGKVDRRALPSPEARAPGSGGAGTPAEELLAGLWSDLLGVSRVGPNDDFFALGGHSLLATQAISRVRRLFGVDLPVSALFEAPTPAALAGRIAAARGAAGPVAPPIVPAPRNPEGEPLSFAQQRLWFLDRLEPGSVAYNVPGALRLTGPLSPNVLGRALAEIVRRHEALRTVFREGPREPVQVVLPPADRPLPVVDLAGLPEAAREAEAGRLLAREARRPFDLAAGPLIRAALLRLGEEEHRLAIVLHHVISDAWSMGIMLRELGALYRAFAAGIPSPLPELPVQYADFAVWQRRWLAGEVLRREVEHWKRGLAGAPEALLLPLDRPRPAVPSRPGARVPFVLPPDLAADLKALGRREGWTAFMILLAAFEALLARLSGQRDVVVGSPIANRNRLETEGLIGFFTNTLALRLDLAGDPSFRTLAHRARAVTLDAHAHQDLPFEKLVEELHPGRDLARTPVFQVMLVFQSLPSLDPGFPGVAAELLDVSSGAAKLDLMLSLVEDGMGGLAGDLEYDREIFEEETASRLASRFAALLAEAVGDPERTLSSLSLLTPAERDEIAAWNEGRPPGQGRIFVLGPDLDVLPAGVPGELYVAGPGLAPGEPGQPDRTAERFIPDPFSWAKGWEPGDRLSRTGDLARWRPGGEIEILGRSGPQDEVRGVPAPEEGEEIIAPRTPVEELLARVFREVLEIPRVGVSQSFFELGGHSLLAARLVFRVREVFGVEIPLRRVFERPVLADLAAEIEAAVATGTSTLAPPLRPVPHDGPLPLSFAQERLWFLDRLEEGGALYNVPLSVRLRGELSVSAFAAAFREIVRRHEALRTVFPERDGEPVQVIGPPPAAWELPVVDLQALPAAAREAEARSLGEREALAVFPLDRGPLLSTTLLRLAEREHLLILNMHHIVSDGWSLGVLLAELGTLYGAARAGAPSPLPPLPVQYVDFAVWQRRWLSGERLAAQVEFWRRQLAGVPAVFELPADRPRPAVQTQNGSRVPVRVPRKLAARLSALARRRGVTPFMLLLAAWQALLHRSTGQEDFNVGSPVAGRNRRETERMIGFFVNTLVLRADLSGNPAFEELLLRTRRVALAAYSHHDLPFEKLVDELKPARDLAHQPLVQVMFSLQNTPLGALEMPGLVLEPLELGETLAKFDVTLALSEARGEIAGTLEYNTDLFDRSTTARLANHLGVLLESIAGDPARRISDLHLLTDGERHQLLLEWADAGRSFHGVSLHQLFERQAALRPGTPAAVFEELIWSYGELDRRANQLAHYLLRLGVGPEVRVGLFVERSLDMLAGMLGVLKTGGAYVPLDPGYPRERLAFTLDDSAARVVLTQERLVDRLPETGARVVRLDADWEEISREPGESPEVPVAADDLAYVIYTSGSTGKPKGVMIPHRAAVMYISTTSPFFGIGPGGRNMQFSSISFDASVEEIYGCITHGATLYVRGEVQGGISELLSWMTERGITWAQLPTAFWHQLTAAMETEDLPFPPTLRVLMIGGEKALAQRLVAWWKRVPEEFRFINAYGPTETTVAATLAAFPGARPVRESLLEVPLGRPLSFVRAYVLDRRLRPVPIGVTGELHLGGQGLARGYLGRPDLTAEKFIPNPFAHLAGKTGERLYRTGDLVRLLPDGMLEFVGRVDDQVKIRGFRIELGEIETTLARHPSVGEAVVMTREDAPGEKHLVAYVAARSEPAPTPEELSAFLSRQLPAYMVPGAFLVLPSMPMNAHGKVDRRALAGIAPGPPRSRQETYVAPQSELEEKIAAVWREIFGLEQVGVHDNFFDLGGNSLLIVKLHSRLQRALGRDFPLVDLFRHPTVAALAANLGAVRTEKPSLDRARARTETRRESMKQLQELRDRRRKAEKGTVRKP